MTMDLNEIIKKRNLTEDEQKQMMLDFAILVDFLVGFVMHNLVNGDDDK